MSPVRTRMWNGTVLLGGAGEEPGWSNPFVADWGAPGSQVGIVEPIGALSPGTTNVGAGIFEDRPYPTATIAVGAGITFNNTTKTWSLGAGVHVENLIIPGHLNGADGSDALNCVIQGPPAEIATERSLVEGPNTIGQMTLRWCTIDPVVASSYYNGIGRGVKASYCDVANVTDGVRGFSNSVNGVRIQCYATDFHDSAQFRPDVANPRPETHNDTVVQAQGNASGNDDDLAFYGCRGDARHSLTKGTAGTRTRTQIAAIMVTPAIGAVHMKFLSGWLYGGIFCVNAGSDGVNTYGPSTVTVKDTRMERPGTDARGDGRAPDIALAIDSSLAFTHSGNTYMDNGATVPRTNA